jgi:hypothetical protein
MPNIPSPTTSTVQALHPHDEHAIRYVYVPDSSDLSQRFTAPLHGPGPGLYSSVGSENRGT